MRLIQALLAMLCASTFITAQVVINEVVYDDTSTDNREFVEIYNAGPNPVDISGWMLENADNGGNSLMGTVVVPLGTTLMPGAFFVFGNIGVPNLNITIPLNSLENDMEITRLKDASGIIQDTVTYEVNLQTAGFPFSQIEGQGIWGNQISTDTSPTSWSRWTDGLDTNDNGRDFGNLPITPGTSNTIGVNLMPWSNNFDTLVFEQADPSFIGSFINPFVVDPALVSAHNPNLVVPSPQGGQCLTAMDPTGGGDCAFFLSAPASDFALEAWVYLPAFTIPVTTAPAEYQSFSIGVRGTTDAFHNHPAGHPGTPPVAPAQNSNGNTGIAWEYIHNATLGSGLLKLVDEGNGGADEIVLASYTILPGVNDGWQRLRLAVAGDVIDANFGGAMGNPASGLRTLALTSTTGVGGFYIGYREFIVNNTLARPLLIDDLTLFAGTAPYSVFLGNPASGMLTVHNRGVVPGADTWNIFSIEACPGGVGTGPYLGLCTSDFNFLLNQFLLPAGAEPFHILPASADYNFGPIPLPVGFYLEVLSFDVSGLSLNNIAPVDSILLL
jgi:hypothetical protein